jgi:hypothetical protein
MRLRSVLSLFLLVLLGTTPAAKQCWHERLAEHIKYQHAMPDNTPQDPIILPPTSDAF